jgi:hypothetical protein
MWGSAAAVLVSVVVTQAAAESKNPFLAKAIEQLRALDERAALVTLAQAQDWAKDAPRELAMVNLYEGLAYAGLNEKVAAEDAFRAALLLDPAVALAPDASPVVLSWWREAGGTVPASVSTGETQPAKRTPWWIPAAVAVGLGATAGICYGEALSRYQTLTGPPALGLISPPTEHSLQTQGSTLQTVSVIAAASGAVALGTAVIMAVSNRSGAPATPTVTPTVTSSGVGILVVLP